VRPYLFPQTLIPRRIYSTRHTPGDSDGAQEPTVVQRLPPFGGLARLRSVPRPPDIYPALPGGDGISGSALALRKAGRPPSPKVIAAGAAVEKFLALTIARDWKAVGEGESHPGTEIEDFIRVLWQPLKESGEFEFGVERTGGRVVFNVTRCPIHNLARKTGLRDWPFHLACATDFYTTPAFCPRIGFTRTKTLIAGDDCRNHTYCCR
jgi:hypothetical protein